MRLAVYCDYAYRVQDERLYAEEPISRFLAELAPYFERLVFLGRLDPAPGRYPYLLEGVQFAPLPHYSSGARLHSLVRALPAAIARFWRLLGEVDVAWILGPNPQALVFALLTLLRGKRLVLGVRQDLPRLFAHRYPTKPLLRWGAAVLEATFRALAHVAPVVVVGPDLARGYHRSVAVHVIYVSLIGERDILAPERDERVYDGSSLRMLSVGRLDPEKNPLLLADILGRLVRHDPRWHLHVCGDGPLMDAVRERLEQLGVSDHASLHGHLPIDGGLLDLYRCSHVFLHVSLTEGVPQVLLEAFATRLPVVATAVGGVPELVRTRGLLIPPGDADAAVAAVDRLITRPALRAELVEKAVGEVRLHTRESECARLAPFLAGESPATVEKPRR